MPRNNLSDIIRGIGAAFVLSGCVLHAPALVGWWHFITAFIGGNIVEGTLSFSEFLLVQINPIMFGVKLAIGISLFRLRWGARKLALALLFFETIFLLYSLTRYIMMVHQDALTVKFPSLLLVHIGINIALFLFLLLPNVVQVFPYPVLKDSQKHQKRIARFISIRDSWKRLGANEDTVIINIALVSFICAPFTYAIAFLYYLFLVLPNSPRPLKNPGRSV